MLHAHALNPKRPWPHAQVIDVDGVNRTPKPLVTIVPSAALRQAKGLLSDDAAATPRGGEGDGFVQLLSSAGFSRGWFDSGAATPLGGEASVASAAGERPHTCNSTKKGGCSSPCNGLLG